MNMLFEVTDAEGRKLWCAGVALTCAAGIAVITIGTLIYAACERWPALINGLMVIGGVLFGVIAALLYWKK